MDKELAASYLGPTSEPCARTTDAVVVLDDEGELPVHAARLCFGVLTEAVTLALDAKQQGKTLRISVPACGRADLALFLGLVYQIRPDKAMKSLSAEELMRAGLIAHRLGHQDLFLMLEESLLARLCAHNGKHYGDLVYDYGSGVQELLAGALFQQLMDWADTTKSENIASLCGAYLAMQPDQPTFSFAMRHAIRALAKLKAKDTCIFS